MSEGFEVVERNAVYTGFLRLAQYRLRLEASTALPEAFVYRERIEGLRAAAVLPFDPVRGRIVLVKQFRIGALGAAGGAWLLEPPGGVVDAGECGLMWVWGSTRPGHTQAPPTSTVSRAASPARDAAGP